MASTEAELGDFSVRPDVVRLVALAAGIGALAAVVALALLDLIGLVTNAVYFHRLSSHLVSPRTTVLGAVSIVVPIAGGLVVGLMARFGSERIRGHGIPEAMETILVRGSTVEPRLALLKPVSSAVSIGTGGPFGAEGPIIMTGGAVGSVVAQLFHLSASERRVLLVAGACAGMTGVFGTPVAATLFGVELLLFELRPRSMAPVGIACVAAEILRNVFAAHGLLGRTPLFPVPPHAPFPATTVLEAAVVGVAGGALAWVMTQAVYGAEDAFRQLRVHWMWWPAIGGLAVGIGGLVEPRVLGVGYDTIAAMLGGHLVLRALLAVLVAKLVVWALALGSGTSGGILAPILIIGAAMGGSLGSVLPGGSSATWCLLGMAAALAGVTRSPFTAVVFSFELTHDVGSLLPLLLACTAAHLFSSLTLKRSILTEKVARRGFHVVREYSVDPLEALFVRDVMLSTLVTVRPTDTVAELWRAVERADLARRQRLYPVVGPDRELLGAVVWSDLVQVRDEHIGSTTVSQVMRTELVTCRPDETLRMVAEQMSLEQVGTMPVVDAGVDHRGRGVLVGLVTPFELLAGRGARLREERLRERVLRLSPLPASSRRQGRLRSEAPVPEDAVAGEVETEIESPRLTERPWYEDGNA